MQIELCNSSFHGEGLWTLLGRLVTAKGEIPYAAYAMDGDSGRRHDITLTDSGAFSYQGRHLAAGDANIVIVIHLLLWNDHFYQAYAWTSQGVILRRGENGRVTVNISGNAGIIRLGEALSGADGDLAIEQNRGLVRADGAGVPCQGANILEGRCRPKESRGGIALCSPDGVPGIQLLPWPTVLAGDGGMTLGSIILGRSGGDSEPREFFRAIYGPVPRIPDGTPRGRRDPRDPNNVRTLSVSGRHARLSLAPDWQSVQVECLSSSGMVRLEVAGAAEVMVSSGETTSLPPYSLLHLGNADHAVSVRCQVLRMPLPEASDSVSPVGAVFLEIVDPMGRDRCGRTSRSVYICGGVALEEHQGKLWPATPGGDDARLRACRDAAGRVLIGCEQGVEVAGRRLSPGAWVLPAEGMDLGWSCGMHHARRCAQPALTPFS